MQNKAFNRTLFSLIADLDKELSDLVSLRLRTVYSLVYLILDSFCLESAEHNFKAQQHLCLLFYQVVELARVFFFACLCKWDLKSLLESLGKVNHDLGKLCLITGLQYKHDDFAHNGPTQVVVHALVGLYSIIVRVNSLTLGSKNSSKNSLTVFLNCVRESLLISCVTTMVSVRLRLGSKEVLGSRIMLYSMRNTYKQILRRSTITFKFLERRSKFRKASIITLKFVDW
jgi:hypothetical protein